MQVRREKESFNERAYYKSEMEDERTFVGGLQSLQ